VSDSRPVSENITVSDQPVIVAPAATLILLRDSAEGPQVLLQQRNPGAAFVGGAWVFPGGKVDPADNDQGWLALVDISAERANRLLGMDEGALAYWIAALRETVEEAGLLLASCRGEPMANSVVSTAQRLLQEDPDAFLTFCRQEHLTLQTNAVRYLSRWVTPEGLPRRYDTRFFLAQAPAGQTPVQDDHEVVDTRWIMPEQALGKVRQGEWEMVLPTMATLQQLSGYDSVATILHRMGNHIDAKSG